MSLSEYSYAITTKSNDQTWDQTDYKILDAGSGGGTFARESSQATMVYLCEYNYFEKFLDVVLGKTVKTGTTLNRSYPNGAMPEEHPYLYNFFAASAEVEPRGTSENDEDGYPLWKKAKITVVFRPPDYSILSDGDSSSELDRFTTKVPEANTDLQTTLGFFKFVSSDRSLDNPPAFLVASQRLTYTWHQIPVVPGNLGRVPNESTIVPLVGSVNQYTFDNNEPGTILFSAWSARLILPSVATDNNYYWDIAYVFSLRDYGASATPYISGEHIGHNYAYDPLRAVWDLYTTDGTTSGKTMYPYNDLDPLFQVTW